MNKVELSKQISSKMSIKQVEALRFIHTLEEVFEEALLTDNSIIFQNFGTFTLWQQTERPDPAGCTVGCRKRPCAAGY